MDRKFGNQYLERATLRDGTSVELRLLRPEDKRLLIDGLRRMSPESRFFRFFAHRDHLNPRELAYLTELDHENHVAIGAKTIDASGTEIGLGVARFIRLEPPDIAEAAVTVIDDAQGKGLGRLLFEKLVGAAHERGVRVFRFDVLAENEAMLKLVEHLFPGSSPRFEDGIVTIDCPLPAPGRLGEPDNQLYAVLRHAAEGALRVFRRLRTESSNRLLKGTSMDDDFMADVGVTDDDGPAPAPIPTRPADRPPPDRPID